MGYYYRFVRHQNDHKGWQWAILYTKKSYNFYKVNQFLKKTKKHTQKTPQLTQYETDNLTSPISIKKIKFIIFK